MQQGQFAFRGVEAAMQRLDVAERSIHCLPLFDIVPVQVQVSQSPTHHKLAKTIVVATLDGSRSNRTSLYDFFNREFHD